MYPLHHKNEHKACIVRLHLGYLEYNRHVQRRVLHAMFACNFLSSSSSSQLGTPISSNHSRSRTSTAAPRPRRITRSSSPHNQKLYEEGPFRVARYLASTAARCPRSSTIRQLGCRATPPATSCSSPRPRRFDRASFLRPTPPRRSRPRGPGEPLPGGAPRSLPPWARRFDGPTWFT